MKKQISTILLLAGLAAGAGTASATAAAGNDPSQSVGKIGSYSLRVKRLKRLVECCVHGHEKWTGLWGSWFCMRCLRWRQFDPNGQSDISMAFRAIAQARGGSDPFEEHARHVV